MREDRASYGESAFDPLLPWGGIKGSPCGDLNLQRELRSADPRYPEQVEVSFPDLADCRECPVCGGCRTHYGCDTDPGHLEWYLQFASAGEPVCGAEGEVGRRGGFSCELPLGHGGDLHKDTRGNGWGTSPHHQQFHQEAGR